MTNDNNVVLDYASRQRNPRKHLIGLGVVIALHALLAWAVNSGLARQFVKVVKGPVEAVLIEEDIPEPPPPPPPPPQKKDVPPPPPPAYVPPVDIPVNAPASQSSISAVTNSPKVAEPPPAPPPPRQTVRTQAVVNAAACEKPEYPSASRRNEEEGTVHLRFLVGVNGQVTQSEIEKSSGYKRLDEAARAGLSKCQFKPATEDGKPIEAWASMKYTWRLE